MMNQIKNIVFFIVVSTLLQSLSRWLQSNFIEVFLQENLIALLLALMAINTTTISVIMTKLREISDASNTNFSRTILSMKNSITEQIVLLGLASVLLIFNSSKLLNQKWNNTNDVTTILLLTVFLYAIEILYDTAQGVFLIASKENSLLNEQKPQ